jgi:DNA (cytosine-5)-methyltransferase 1
LIKKKPETIEHKELIQSDISEGVSWKDLEFAYPQRTIRIGTVFSGIGAIEHAFQRLKLKQYIVKNLNYLKYEKSEIFKRTNHFNDLHEC